MECQRCGNRGAGIVSRYSGAYYRKRFIFGLRHSRKCYVVLWLGAIALWELYLVLPVFCSTAVARRYRTALYWLPWLCIQVPLASAQWRSTTLSRVQPKMHRMHPEHRQDMHLMPCMSIVGTGAKLLTQVLELLLLKGIKYISMLTPSGHSW